MEIKTDFRVLAQHDLPKGGTILIVASKEIDGRLACDVIELLLQGIRKAEMEAKHLEQASSDHKAVKQEATTL